MVKDITSSPRSTTSPRTLRSSLWCGMKASEQQGVTTKIAI